MTIYDVVLCEYGHTEYVDTFTTKQEAAKFIVDHKAQFNDERHYELRENES